MNDVYEAFASAALENYQTKNKAPKSMFTQSHDIESSSIFTSRPQKSLSNSSQMLKANSSNKQVVLPL